MILDDEEHIEQQQNEESSHYSGNDSKYQHYMLDQVVHRLDPKVNQ